MSDIRYGEASLRAKEYSSNKVKSELNKNVTDQGLRFVKLTSMIPNWETYLTPKQRESAKRYLSTMNANEVDWQLNLSFGTTYQRIFGSAKSKGAIGRLEEIYKMLENSGFFAVKQKEAEQKTEHKAPVKMTSKTLDKVRELFSLISNTPNWKNYLTEPQIEKVTALLETRSFKKGAAACDVSMQAYQTSLIGDKGVLDRLRRAKEMMTVNTWEEI